MKKYLTLAMVMLLCHAAGGQTSQYLETEPAGARCMPGSLNMSLVDGNLYCHNGLMMLKSAIKEGLPVYFEPDRQMTQIDPEMDYVVQHPVSGGLYYTKSNRKGFSTLYQYLDDGKKMKSVPVKFDEMKISVHHPVFSPDGQIMVFSSNYKKASGTYDLWYSRWRRDGWSAPRNLGKRVNTRGNEVSPMISGDYLIFASDGRVDGRSDYNLYVTRLVATRQEGDTVSMFPIGQSQVQELPSPIRSPKDETEFIPFPLTDEGLWMVKDSNDIQIFHFSGSIRGTLLYGRTMTADSMAVKDVSVELWEDGRLKENIHTDDSGTYRLWVRSDREYELRFLCRNFYRTSITITTTRESEELAISPIESNILMSRLPLGEVQEYRNLFGSGASVELSAHDKEILIPLTQFLKDNPHLSVKMTLESYAADDPDFNRLLTDHRIEALRSYFSSELPKGCLIEYKNGCETSDNGENTEHSNVLSVAIGE